MNRGLLGAWNSHTGTEPETSQDLAAVLGLEPLPLNMIQHYQSQDIKVKVI
jgi:hypothetical protein